MYVLCLCSNQQQPKGTGNENNQSKAVIFKVLKNFQRLFFPILINKW